MELCGLPREYSNYGMELHVVAVPAQLFHRAAHCPLYETPIVLAGLALTAAAALVGMSGQTVARISGGTRPAGRAELRLPAYHGAPNATRHRKACAQSINDFVVFGTMVIGRFASGSLLGLRLEHRTH